MIKEALEYLQSLARPEQFTASGNLFVLDDYKQKETRCTIPDVRTLTGIVDYVKNVKELPEGSFAHVMAYNKVEIVSQMYVENDVPFRYTFVTAFYPDCLENNIRHSFSLNSYTSLDDFILGLQRFFYVTEDKEKLLKVCSKVTNEAVIGLADDGITQNTTVKKGVALNQEASIKNPVSLRPRQTFPEIKEEELERDFIFRIKKNDNDVVCGLFDTGDQYWHTDLIIAVRAFLQKELDIPVIG